MNVKNGADVYFTLYRDDSRMRLDHILDNFDSQSCSTLFAADHPWGKQGISNFGRHASSGIDHGHVNGLSH